MESELYNNAIIHEARNNMANRLTLPTSSATIFSPLCGDRISVDVQILNGRIVAIGQEVKGCILCQAATSIMTKCALNQSVDSLSSATSNLLNLLKNGTNQLEQQWSALSIFAPVSRHKSRHDCIILPFQALNEAVSQSIKTLVSRKRSNNKEGQH